MAPRFEAVWQRLSLDGLPLAYLQRSSHSLSIVGGRAYIFGGELEPRRPIGNEVLVIDLNGRQTSGPLASRVLRASDGQAWPAARVGATMTAHPSTNSFFLWGGRGGKSMEAIEDEHIWRFDTNLNEWSHLQTGGTDVSTGEVPVPRSFHTSAASDGHLYIHAGCPTSGRLSSLHSLDLESLQWRKLSDAPEPARGGTALIPILAPAHSDAPAVFARWGGFCGHELGGPLDIYDPSSGAWTSHDVALEEGSTEPAKRSVHGFIPFDLAPGRNWALNVNGVQKEALAVLFMGEGEGAPKELGHDGAGKFLSDIHVLLREKGSASYSWLTVQPNSVTAGDSPQPRGWFACDAQADEDGHTVRIVFQGGLNASNERLHDAWVLRLSLKPIDT